jgi:hypothetical protein
MNRHASVGIFSTLRWPQWGHVISERSSGSAEAVMATHQQFGQPDQIVSGGREGKGPFLFCSNISFVPTFFFRGTTSCPLWLIAMDDLKRRNSCALTRSQQWPPLCLSFPMRRSHKKSTLAPAGSESVRVIINIAYTIAPKNDVRNCAKRASIKSN